LIGPDFQDTRPEPLWVSSLAMNFLELNILSREDAGLPGEAILFRQAALPPGIESTLFYTSRPVVEPCPVRGKGMDPGAHAPGYMPRLLRSQIQEARLVYKKMPPMERKDYKNVVIQTVEASQSVSAQHGQALNAGTSLSRGHPRPRADPCKIAKSGSGHPGLPAGYALRRDAPALAACGHCAETDWDVSTPFVRMGWFYDSARSRLIPGPAGAGGGSEAPDSRGRA
jgi:hypothetical protein